jgi:hypothetical protein
MIHFTGSNNKSYNTKRGNAYDLAACDEGRDIDDLEALIESVILPALFTTNGFLLLASTPADTEDSPLHSYYEQAVAGKWYSHYTIYDAAKWDPTHYPADRIAEWRKETKEDHVWQREYMAAWTRNASTVVIPEFKKDYIKDVSRTEFFKYYHKYVALDTGVRDKTVGLFAYYDFIKSILVVEDEIVLSGDEVISARIASLVQAKELELEYVKVYRRIADCNNLIIINDMNRYGLNFYPTNKGRLEDMLGEVRVWIDNKKILIKPNCKELIGCLTNAVWNKQRTELGRSKVYGHFDALASLVYLVRNLDTTTNPIPLLYGKSISTHHIPAEDLKKAQETAFEMKQSWSKFNQETELPVAYDPSRSLKLDTPFNPYRGS